MLVRLIGLVAVWTLMGCGGARHEPLALTASGDTVWVAVASTHREAEATSLQRVDAKTFKVVQTYAPVRGRAVRVVTLPGERVAVALNDGIAVFAPHSDTFHHCAVDDVADMAADGQTLWLAAGMRLWAMNPHTCEVVPLSVKLPAGRPVGLLRMADGRGVVGLSDGRAFVFKPGEAAQATQIAGLTAGAALAPEGQIATLRHDGWLTYWTLKGEAMTRAATESIRPWPRAVTFVEGRALLADAQGLYWAKFTGAALRPAKST